MAAAGRDMSPLRRAANGTVTVLGVAPSTAALDRLWRQVVLQRAGYRCERCGSLGRTRGVQAHHIFSRASQRIRWDPANGVCLCSGCHLSFAHTRPDAMLALAERLRGRPTIDRLRLLRDAGGAKTDREQIRQTLRVTLDRGKAG